MLLFVVASEMTLTRAFFLRVASSENSSLKICQNLPQNQLHLKPLKNCASFIQYYISLIIIIIFMEASTTTSASKTPADFLKSIRGKRVVVKLNSGVDYRGILIEC